MWLFKWRKPMTEELMAEVREKAAATGDEKLKVLAEDVIKQKQRHEAEEAAAANPPPPSEPKINLKGNDLVGGVAAYVANLDAAALETVKNILATHKPPKPVVVDEISYDTLKEMMTNGAVSSADIARMRSAIDYRERAIKQEEESKQEEEKANAKKNRQLDALKSTPFIRLRKKIAELDETVKEAHEQEFRFVYNVPIVITGTFGLNVDDDDHPAGDRIFRNEAEKPAHLDGNFFCGGNFNIEVDADAAGIPEAIRKYLISAVNHTEIDDDDLLAGINSEPKIKKLIDPIIERTVALNKEVNEFIEEHKINDYDIESVIDPNADISEDHYTA